MNYIEIINTFKGFIVETCNKVKPEIIIFVHEFNKIGL